MIAQAVALLIYEQRICMSRSSKYAKVMSESSLVQAVARIKQNTLYL